jgi:hypothetical protein
MNQRYDAEKAKMKQINERRDFSKERQCFSKERKLEFEKVSFYFTR